MSEAKQSIAALAADACAMPWEDKAPFSTRYAFKEAVTPELVAELLEALRPFAHWASGFGPHGREDSWVIAKTPAGKTLTMGDVRRAHAAYAKATGSAA